jgi:hypothetical protein
VGLSDKIEPEWKCCRMGKLERWSWGLPLEPPTAKASTMSVKPRAMHRPMLAMLSKKTQRSMDFPHP